MRALGSSLSLALGPGDRLQRKAWSDGDPCSAEASLCLARLASGEVLNPFIAIRQSPPTSLPPAGFSALLP